ncbi:dephospho-CoA kinase [Fodinicola acaciae]|uniref:dephospho-CoA kinase n=1 Tax=Fodinicola acaciae TaxID=2681555 RepID=UPI0013D4115A|nr:dephospho-CoA kinase [Fodinicola acaciae]
MLRIGLTGGIGAGKSAVSGRLAARGAVVIDADKLAREVVAPGTPGLAAIREAFGDDVIADGALDRPALARIVFADEARRRQLNAIVHPLVGARTAELMHAAWPEAIVVHDVPLLVENGLAPAYHLVVIVHAPVDVRIDRLHRDRGMTTDEARARIGSQATEEQRRAVADVWLDNSGSLAELEKSVDTLWDDRLVPYEANIRERRNAWRSGRAEIVPHDPTWPVQAERIANRLRTALGERATRVDHIGSTSVPDLAAKDILDMMVSVRSIEDADAIADTLNDAGFPPNPRIRSDEPKPADPDPAHWAKRYHNNADPGRTVNLHVRVEGWPNWRYALLFRDWLRADAGARADYERHKLALAAEHGSYEAYAIAKEPWFDRALPLAEAWSKQAGWSA